MKRLLILGAGPDQVPAIQLAKEMGYFVITSDFNPKSLGFLYADKYYVVSTNDYEGNLKIAQEEKIDGIMTLISETSVPVIGKISEKLGLPGYNYHTALAATNKNVMHQVMHNAGVPMPQSWEVSDMDQARKALNQSQPPWVIKPSDSSGQRGVFVFHDPKELEINFNKSIKYSTDKKAVVEEYIVGPEINVTTIVRDGKVQIMTLSDRITLPSPHFGIAVKHKCPPEISAELQEQIKELAIRSSAATGIKDGITYPQIIANENGPRLLEIAIRIPGGNLREMVLYKTGIDLIEVAIYQALNEPFDLEKIKKETNQAVFIYHFTKLDMDKPVEKYNTLVGWDDISNIPEVKKTIWRLDQGQKIPELDWSGGRFASVILGGDSLNQCVEIFNKDIYPNIKIG